MHKILAGILHLGNIEIMLDENDFACVKENKALLSASVSHHCLLVFITQNSCSEFPQKF